MPVFLNRSVGRGRRARWRSAAGRPKRAAFWCAGRHSLAVAVLARTADEPLLEACASASSQSTVPALVAAPGLLELVRVADAAELDHVVALDDELCSLHSPMSPDDRGVPVDGLEGTSAVVDCDTVDAVVSLFEDARLKIVALDSAACARMSLAAFLHGGAGSGAGRDDAGRPDPLAAVSVEPHCELEATSLGGLLAAPVGLALVWYGLVADADG